MGICYTFAISRACRKSVMIAELTYLSPLTALIAGYGPPCDWHAGLCTARFRAAKS